jgi:signal transduction histidine kinase
MSSVDKLQTGRRFDWPATAVWTWIRRNSFTPHWLPAHWRLPWLGYLAAVLLQIVAGLLTFARLAWSPDFVLPGIVELLVVAVVALAWGVGPSLLATVAGAILLVLVGFPVDLGSQETGTGLLTEAGLFVTIGVIMSLLTSRTEHARQRALAERGAAYVEARKARSRERHMEEFVSLTGHELQTPLASLRMSLQLLGRRLQRLQTTRPENEGDAEAAAQQVQAIQQALALADEQIVMQSRLVSDLLDSARIQANTFAIIRERCDLVAIVKRAVREQQLLHPGHTILLDVPERDSLSLQARTGDVAVPVYVDQGRIGQVLRNYLTNALHYSPPSLPVEVTLVRDGSDRRWRVEVADHGPGIPPGELEQIWERGQRGTSHPPLDTAPQHDTTSPTAGSPGLGLGLYLSRTIIERHSGQVGVESIPCKGARFWFTLPPADSAPGRVGDFATVRPSYSS